jgi:hypothetical protein
MQRFKRAMARMPDAKETANDRGLGVKDVNSGEHVKSPEHAYIRFHFTVVKL